MIKIIDYKAGNAASVLHAVNHLGYRAEFAHNAAGINEAAHIILPGVGSAKATMESLTAMNLIGALEDAVLGKKVFFLGICVGLQVLFEHSEEDDADCLGWLKGKVVKFDASKVRVPQMGWNRVNFIKNAFNETAHQMYLREGFFYFVNSYYAVPIEDSNQSSVTWGTADYDGDFAAAVCRDNIYATQFHIEKSGEPGLSLLKKFLSLKEAN